MAKTNLHELALKEGQHATCGFMQSCMQQRVMHIPIPTLDPSLAMQPSPVCHMTDQSSLW